jgi:[ribosomal protein S5]-alanine N-acetyltransferase
VTLPEWLECRAGGPAGRHHLLHGARVELRPLAEADLDDLVAAYDDVVARDNHGYRDRPLDDVVAYALDYITHASLDPLIADLAMLEPTTGDLLGHVQLVAMPEGDPSRMPVQLGFTVHPRARGRGVATEAVSLAIRLAHEHLGVHEVWAETVSWNHAAARVMTAAGMRSQPGAIRALPDGRRVASVRFGSRRSTPASPLLRCAGLPESGRP